ncbi:uncharacterized protein LOC131631158 [Vicia villosa]|uniref:uncharacterized protein LOC131631158 n=1 Tax=Vicia villosa TaxID=3911 RepID=UPI00273B7EAA|nr:uncharacterized protein LOC131631158 [Vicia villosa]
MTYSGPFNIPERTKDQLGLENSWERLKREAEIRRVLELISVAGQWRRAWERANRRKWKGCLWKRETHFRVVMGALEKRLTSIQWKAGWQSAHSGVCVKGTGKAEGMAVDEVVIGSGDRKRKSRREAERNVIVLSSDSEREEKHGKEFDKCKKRQMTKKGPSTTVEEREERDGTGCNKLDESRKKQYGPSGIVKERSSDWKGKEVMVEDEDDHISISSDKER